MIHERSHHEQPGPRYPRWWSRLAVLLLLVLTVLLVVASGRKSPPHVPVDAVMSSAGRADESTCQDCHEQAESFWETGHARTLRRASHPKSLELLEQFSSAERPAAEGTRIEIHDGAVMAINQAGQSVEQLPLDWCFGSGDHAVTWTSTMTDSMGATDQLEFRWSWYRQADGFAVTPGQSDDPPAGFYGKLGEFLDGPKTRRCFSCHSNYLPGEDAQIVEEHIVGGVTCQRCHGPRQQHVDSEGAIKNEHWRPADRMDAVHRCAQCHRRAEEQEPHYIQPEEKEIVRFQPVGLVQSPCFTHSQMTCTTCHDPHKPLEAQDSRGIWQCVQCHDPQQAGHVTCGAGKTDHCLTCHMPAIQMEAPLKFTDHWIRIREAGERAP